MKCILYVLQLSAKANGRMGQRRPVLPVLPAHCCPLYLRKRPTSCARANVAKDHFRIAPQQSCCRYSITSSARATSEGGTVSPSVFAVCRFKTSWNFVGC